MATVICSGDLNQEQQHSKIMDAQQTIANASGGRALQGLLPEGGDADNNTDKFSSRQHLLQSVPATGEGFRIRNPSQSTVSTAYSFACSDDALTFANSVAEKGWSFALALHSPKVLPGAANAILSTDRTQEELSGRQLLEHMSQAFTLECHYVPLHCFQIPREQMMLSESTLQRACTIESSADADAFLKSFGAFASESCYHLGSLSFSLREAHCSEKSSTSALRNRTAQEMKGSVGADCPYVGAQASGKLRKSRDGSSIKGSTSKELEERKYIQTLGPNAIIDKSPDTSNTLVSVWSLLVQHADRMVNGVQSTRLKQAAGKLCDRWLEKASRQSSSIEHTACYKELMQESRVFLDKLASDPALGLQYKHLPRPAPAPLTQSSQMDLIDRLDQILREAEDPVSKVSNFINISQRVSLFLSQRSYSELSQIESDVLRAYGFHPDTDDYECSMKVDQLNLLIQELREAKSAGEHALILPPVNWEQNDGIQHCDVGSIVEPPLSPCFSYFGDVVVDRIFNTCAKSFELEPEAKDHSQDSACHPALCRHLIDCMRHRLDHLRHLVLPSSSVEVSESSDGEFDESESDKELEGDRNEQASEGRIDLMRISPFELLIQIVQGSDLHLQIVLCDLLLSQRSAIPLIMSRIKPLAADQDEVPLVQYMDVLKFVTVKVENERKLCLGTDTQLPRVLFLSSKSLQESHAAIIASRVCNCNFLSKNPCNDNTDEATVMEVGVGFIECHKQRDIRESGYWECVAIHVSGNFERAKGFIGDIADVIVVELKEEGQDAQPINLPPSATAVKWRETGSKAGFDKRTKVIEGQETSIVKELQGRLGKTIRSLGKKPPKPRLSIIEACRKHQNLLRPAHPQLDDWEKFLVNMFGQCDIRIKLLLHCSHKKEAKAFFGGLNSQNNDRISKHEKDMACKFERENRRKLAGIVIKEPLINFFYQVLKEESATKRRFGITWIERSLAAASEGSESIFQKHASYSHETKQNNANKIRLENLWREMGHIYEADADKQRDVARLAAQHLLDGFPLEILDGDVRMYCKLWVEAVLDELEILVAKPGGPRIFVLSVMGMQSSGKSTMMNLMFGTRLRTGTGRCTRGVYIQLVPAKRQEYDYVLLVDTEGLKSPENTGRDGSAVCDNQLATFGLLLADACLFMVCNEDDVAVKEVLPMVLLAFKGSKIAQMYGETIKTKLILVYRSVDTTDKEKLKKSARLVEEHLEMSAHEVGQMGCFLSASSSPAINKQNSLSTSTSNQSMTDQAVVPFDFKVTGPGNQGDVWFMGNIKSGSNPPKDTPEWSYGERVIELREYLHSRVVNNSGGWKASSFQGFAMRVSLAWDCICSADFELTFDSRVEYASYLELHEKLQPQRSVIFDNYMEAFRSLERRKFQDDADKPYDEAAITQWTECFLEDVKNYRDSQTNEVNRILDMRKIYGKWKAEELVNWGRFCNNTEDWYKRRIEDLVSGVLRFGKIVAEYQRRCKSKLVSENGKDRSDVERQEMFEVILKEIVDDAERIHPPIAADVRQKVCAQYSINKLGNVSNMDDEHVSGNCFLKRFCLITGDKPSTAIPKAITGSENSESHSPNGIEDSVHIPSERSDGPIIQKLESMIESKLEGANQYSDAIVESVIKATKEVLRDDQSVAKRSKQQQEEIHYWVKNTLIGRLKEIQGLWDKKYNVAEKLKSTKIRVELQHFFDDVCKGLEATALLFNQLRRSLEEKLEEIYHDAVVSYMERKLEKAAWMRDWQVMRAILDYHLLTLMEMKDSTGRPLALLQYATNTAEHYTRMLEALVGQAITEEESDREWDRLVDNVRQCLKNAAPYSNTSAEVFLGFLRKELTEMVDPKLGEAICSIHVEDKSRKLDGEFCRNNLPQLFESLQKLPKLDINLIRADITEAVLRQMENSPDEHCRPRCKVVCPQCGSMCHLAKGHDINYEKHDTLHQPAGLIGSTWVNNKRLVPATCLGLLKAGCKMIRKNGDRNRVRKVNFEQFEEVYSGWKKPSSGYDPTDLNVRKCLFFNFHGQLAEHWAHLPADDIPTQYQHIHAAELHADFHSFLRLKIRDRNECEKLLHLLEEVEL